jgi:pyrroline-5-carboxylate reductase
MARYKIGFFGAGKMAEGILSALPDKTEVIMSEKVAERRQELEKKYPAKVVSDLKEVASSANIVFLSVKPQDVDAVAAEVKKLLKPTQTLVSIVAGRKISVLRKAFGAKVKIVRVMPNLALRANAGMCAVCGDKNVSKAMVGKIARILGAAGESVILEERDFDAVTGLSGSGPAYFAYMEEAMMEAGVKLGLKRDVARLLAEQTMYGTAKYLRESGADLGEFISGVCTKGGTTAAGMTELSNPEFKNIVAKTLKAAAKRSKELAG